MSHADSATRSAQRPMSRQSNAVLPLALAMVCVLCTTGITFASKEPPLGPPWMRDFGEAHRLALQTGKPMFLYFTKTYCPHCVVMEKNLFPDPALEPVYSKAVWLYVYRDFSETPADLAAQRIELRFSVSSYPQHFLIDPESLEILGNTGRAVSTFLPAVEGAATRVRPSTSLNSAQRVVEGDRRAMELEQTPDVSLAQKYLDDADIVVRFRALAILAEKDPQAVASRAKELLAVPNDPFRYEVCTVLANTGDGKASRTLEELVQRPANSKNPNVLRIRAVMALGECGNAKSVPVIAPFASSGEYLNGLTGTSVDALAAIALRHADAKDAVRNILIRSYPQPSGQPTATHQRYCMDLAKRVHSALEQVTGRSNRFPDVYDSAARAKLVASW